MYVSIMGLLVFATKHHFIGTPVQRGMKRKNYICILFEKITFMSSGVINITESDPMVNKILRIINRISKIVYDHQWLWDRNIKTNVPIL